MVTPEKILKFFLPNQQQAKLQPLGQGKINDTWLVTFSSGERLVLQRLPAAVFPDPQCVMHNIRLVTSHLHAWSQQTKLHMPFLSLYTNPDGKDLFIDPSNNGWRLLTYIDCSRTVEELDSPQQAYEIGRMLGLFHTVLADVDQGQLRDPLPGFHDTLAYIKKYNQLSHQSAATHLKEAACIQFIEEMRGIAVTFTARVDTLTHLVIHGDPKASNFLFAENKDTVISIIDLDTVQAGLLLHDLGDCLRSCCNRQGEEHDNPEGTIFSAEFFAAILKGYGSVAASLLSEADLQILPDAAALISFELGVRFFTDHLSGDAYFKTSKKGQNLVRALIQFHLANSIARQQVLLHKIVADTFRTYPQG
jgi:Ser/Thr protein kinase RdoA (MazF antagonist)